MKLALQGESLPLLLPHAKKIDDLTKNSIAHLSSGSGLYDHIANEEGGPGSRIECKRNQGGEAIIRLLAPELGQRTDIDTAEMAYVYASAILLWATAEATEPEESRARGTAAMSHTSSLGRP